jgi:hypothetical protein
LSLSLPYIGAVIANLWHPVIPSPFVILRERSDRRISFKTNTTKNLYAPLSVNSAKQFEEINVVVNKE